MPAQLLILCFVPRKRDAGALFGFLGSHREVLLPLTKHMLFKQNKPMTAANSSAVHRTSLQRLRNFFALVLLVLPLGISLHAANMLVNPSMESGLSSGWTIYGRTGQEGWYSYALASLPDPTVTGNNSFKVYAAWNADPNFTGEYQDVACLPTTVFTASGWFHTKGNDKIVGTYGGASPDSGNTCWIEVTFRDAANNVLALYKSAVFDSAASADTWYDMQITNQCDLVTTLPVSSVTSLVAPEGTAKVRYQVVLKQSAWQGGGALFIDDMVLDQVSGPTAPTIGNIAPGALLLANAANGLSFTVSSSSGTTIDAAAIQVTLNGSNISSGLAISGSASSKNVSYNGLQPGQTYDVAITATDVLGLSTAASFSFDTFAPLFLWEGEDYDFSSGQWILNPVLASAPQANSYFGVSGQEGVDFNELTGDGDKLYRPSDRLATTTAGDVPRQSFITAQGSDPLIKDYKIGWFNGGEWANYTRNFPAGTYNVYARLGGGNGWATVTLSKVTSGQGTAEQTVTSLGQFSFVGTAWSTYQYVPLRDAYGNLVKLTIGGTNTLRVTTGGGADVNFLMFVAPDTRQPIITGAYPNGSTLLQGTNKFCFSVTSANGTIDNSGIAVKVNNVDVTSKLTITGDANNKTVSYSGLPLNTYGLSIWYSVTNTLGFSAGGAFTCDTFSPAAYTWEAEDYDYNGGQYMDWQTNSYLGLIGSMEIDYHDNFDVGLNPNLLYRTSDAMGTDVTGDTKRLRCLGTNDYNIGWFTGGEWVNFTRPFPAGNFHVYARCARGTGTNATPTLSRVTSGVGTMTQTLAPIGKFSVDSKGWGNFNYVLLTDNVGQPVTFSPDGNPLTLRLTSTGPETNTEANVNFFMLVPIANPVGLSCALVGNSVVLSFPTAVDIGYQVQYADDLANLSWKDLGVVVAGNGSTQSVADSTAAPHRLYRLRIQ
jgi:hypothetical protein